MFKRTIFILFLFVFVVKGLDGNNDFNEMIFSICLAVSIRPFYLIWKYYSKLFQWFWLVVALIEVATPKVYFVKTGNSV